MDIISAKYLLTMDSTEPIVDGAIAIEGDEIVDVGMEKDLLERYENVTHENYSTHVIMPGLINSHCHLDMTLHKNYPFDPVRNLAMEPNHVDWLLSTIEYKRTTSPDRLREAVEMGIEQSIEAGTTCVYDMGSYEGLFQCLEQNGLRGIIFPEILSYDSFVARDLYETAMAIIEKYMDMDSEIIDVGVGPYSAYTLSRNILKIMAQYSRSSQLPLMMHVSESFSELEFFYDSTGDIATKLFPNIGWGEDLPPAFRKTPIEYLAGIDFLESQPILVGALNLTPADIDRIAASQARIAWCPRSQHYLKLGSFQLGEIMQQGITVGLGTDGLSSTNTLSMWDELRSAFEIAENAGVQASEIFKMATINGAILANIDQDVGSLTPGKKADVIVVDLKEHPDTGDFFENLIKHTKSYHVHKVIVNGRTLKQVN